MYFPSKIDFWIYPVYALITGACLAPLFTGEDRESLWITIPILLFLIRILLKTGYEVKEGVLIIHGGFFKRHISIRDIRSIRKTKNFLSSPALSLDRLEISYGNDYKFVLVSPKDQTKFIAELTSIHSRIELDEKLK